MKKWKAGDEEKRAAIIRSLKDGDKKWNGLWADVKGKIKNKTTLSIYLEALRNEGHIIKKQVTKKQEYSLVRTRYVREVLGEPRGKAIRHAQVDFGRLNEEQIIRAIVTAAISPIQTILYDYVYIGECARIGNAPDNFERALQAHKTNLMDFIDKAGRSAVDRIRKGELDSNRMIEAGRSIYLESKSELLKLSMMDKKTEVIGPTLTIGEILIRRSGDIVRPQDLGVRRLGIIILIPQEEKVVAIAEGNDEKADQAEAYKGP